MEPLNAFRFDGSGTHAGQFGRRAYLCFARRSSTASSIKRRRASIFPSRSSTEFFSMRTLKGELSATSHSLLPARRERWLSLSWALRLGRGAPIRNSTGRSGGWGSVGIYSGRLATGGLALPLNSLSTSRRMTSAMQTSWRQRSWSWIMSLLSVSRLRQAGAIYAFQVSARDHRQRRGYRGRAGGVDPGGASSSPPHP